MTPVALSLSVGLVATLLTLPPGVAVAWFLERSKSRWRGVVQTVVMLPLVLPPVVTGFLLLKLFSRHAPLGRLLGALGLPVAFHWMGAVVAAAVVGFPLLVMSVTLALKGVDPRFEVVSRSLGCSPWQTFWRVTLPLTWPGILSGAALAFARGLGEFGATIVLAGRIPGTTETIPLAVYAQLDAPGGEAKVLGLVAASVALCVSCVVIARWLDAKHRRRLELLR
ncbi:MAG: molybdate ABC transporter permease subunit [Deltaproteobacteria bacterium]|nr:molybdate ABC transporter permease subunit [Deltaproteobacteria bacterium]